MGGMGGMADMLGVPPPGDDDDDDDDDDIPGLEGDDDK